MEAFALAHSGTKPWKYSLSSMLSVCLCIKLLIVLIRQSVWPFNDGYCNYLLKMYITVWTKSVCAAQTRSTLRERTHTPLAKPSLGKSRPHARVSQRLHFRLSSDLSRAMTQTSLSLVPQSLLYKPASRRSRLPRAIWLVSPPRLMNSDAQHPQ